MTWATRITILRLILVPVFVTFIITYDESDPREEIWRYAAIGVFLVASISDAVDGYLARHWNQGSALGALLDPIADKLLLFAALVTLSLIPLGHLRPFPIWFPVIIISRDTLLLGGYAILRHFQISMEIRPHWTGKWSTVFTLLAIGAVLFKLGASLTNWLCALGAGLALACTVIYVRQGLRLLSHSGLTGRNRNDKNYFMEHTVAIVGRPNVGKSALFNCLAGRDISLVFDRPGTTRDRMVTTGRWDQHRLTLIDTGGIGVEDREGFGEDIAREVELALAAATEIIFVVDAREGLTPLDQIVARLLRKSHCPVYVAANKVDGEKQANLDGEFSRLGFKGVFPVSAAHRRGLDALRDAIVADWGEPEPEVEKQLRPVRPTRLAIVGRPNVGKSSLINALIKAPRAIVSEVAGTTRDAVDIAYTWKGEPFLFIDTAGMRQERRLSDALERAMTGRTAHAINRADVCILVIDASTGVTMQDKKIAGLIQEAHAPCMIVVNKWDLAREQGDASKTREREYYDQIKRDMFFLSYAPVLFLSAKSGERIDGLLKTCATIAKNRTFRFQTGPLNRVISRAMEKYAPPLVNGRRFKVLYAAQQAAKEGAREIPTLQLFVNSPGLLTPAYERYLDLQIRESFELRGCPLRFVLRGRTTQAREKTRTQIKHNPPPQRRAPKKGTVKKATR